jgi:ribA/ribD-fused uncharacterized protein
MEKIDKFRNEYRFLSNFWPCEVFYEDMEFMSVEHAYVASKTIDIALREQIRKIRKPGDVKRFGRMIVIRKDFDKIKYDIMKNLVLQKFARNYELGERLLNTSDYYLEEGNTWHDNYWGVCYCEHCKGEKGLNNLGKILMETRTFLTKRRS